MRSIRATCAAFPNGACQLLGWAGVCGWLGTWWRGLNRRGSSTLCRFSLPENQRQRHTDRQGWEKVRKQQVRGRRPLNLVRDAQSRGGGGAEFKVISHHENLSRELFSNSFCQVFFRQSGVEQALKKVPSWTLWFKVKRNEEIHRCSNPGHLF